MSKALWPMYENDIPEDFFLFLNAPAMKRIRGCGMHCGMEYTSFPFYKDFKPYSRYDHSLGVALILYKFTGNRKISLSGLFHDIATPSFAHVIDFLKGDHEKQEATEERTRRILEGDKQIVEGLRKLSLSVEDVYDYHRYPLADNDSPKLSSDRLEYTLNNFLNYRFATSEEIHAFYKDLTIAKNEEGEEEMAFTHLDVATRFTLLTLKNSRVYVAEEDRYGMEYLARLLKRAIDRGVLKEDDLYTTEKEVIAKLEEDREAKADFASFRALKKVKQVDTILDENTYAVSSKKRYINPLVKDKGRVASLVPEVKAAIDSFLAEDFSKILTKA